MAEEVTPTPESTDEPSVARQGCLTRIVPVTTPGCASCLTLVFLVTTVVTVWLAFLLDPSHVPWRHSMGWPRIVTVLVLTLVIPLVVRKLVHLWMEGEESPFPDLDYAWGVGMRALASNGLAIGSIPVYVILGARSEQQERALMNASGRRMRVEGVPEGPASIRWYANPDGIYLFCSDSSWTSALASLREELATSVSARLPASDGPLPLLAAESAMPLSPLPSPPPPPEPGNIQGTLMLDQFVRPGAAASPPSARGADESRAGSQDIRGTMMLGTVMNVADQGSFRVTVSGDLQTPDEPEPVLVSAQYSAACLQELQHLCRLLRRARQSVCGINGILALIQLESIHSSPAETEELQKALRADVTTIQYALGLRCPVTALMVGLEKERGFRELVRRVGRERSASQRFGRKFDVRAIPSGEELASLSLHVCGAFEDWAYTLFREEEALTRPGNTRLYELLSKVRCSWKTKLADILAGGFGCDAEKSSQEDSLLFSGCYLAATGDTPDRQAFVKGVIDKLDEEQELVEWTDEAVTRNRRQGQLASLGTLLVLGLTLSLVAMWILKQIF